MQTVNFRFKGIAESTNEEIISTSILSMEGDVWLLQLDDNGLDCYENSYGDFSCIEGGTWYKLKKDSLLFEIKEE